MLLSLIMAIAVSIVAVFFALENTEPITVSVFGYPLNGASGVLLLGALAIGVLVGSLIMMPALVTRSITIARLRRRLTEVDQSLPETTENLQ